MNVFTIFGTSVLLLLGAGCATPSNELVAQTHKENKWDLSQDAFIEEMLYPQGMARTPRFNDYTPNSYHITKLPLVERVRALNTNEILHTEAVLVLGPAGPLWQYNVITITSTNPTSEVVHVNHLVFPHARITYKTTRLLPRKDMVSLLDRLIADPVLRDILDEDRDEGGEWKLAAIVSTYGTTSVTRVLPNSVMENDAIDINRFYEAVNELLGGESTTTTYSTSATD